MGNVFDTPSILANLLRYCMKNDLENKNGVHATTLADLDTIQSTLEFVLQQISQRRSQILSFNDEEEEDEDYDSDADSDYEEVENDSGEESETDDDDDDNDED
eukprot:gene14451-15995_t